MFKEWAIRRLASAWIIEVERPRKPILDAILAYLKQKDFCRYMLDEGHCAVFDFIARDLGARPSFLLLYRDYAAFSASDRYVAILGIADGTNKLFVNVVPMPEALRRIMEEVRRRVIERGKYKPRIVKPSRSEFIRDVLGFDGGPEAAGERGARARVQGEVVVSTIYSTDSYSDFIDYLTLRAANHMFIINQAALQQASQLFRTEGRLRGLRWMPEFKEVCDLAAMAYSEFLMARRIAPPSVESNYNMERGMVALQPSAELETASLTIASSHWREAEDYEITAADIARMLLDRLCRLKGGCASPRVLIGDSEVAAYDGGEELFRAFKGGGKSLLLNISDIYKALGEGIPQPPIEEALFMLAASQAFRNFARQYIAMHLESKFQLDEPSALQIADLLIEVASSMTTWLIMAEPGAVRDIAEAVVEEASGIRLIAGDQHLVEAHGFHRGFLSDGTYVRLLIAEARLRPLESSGPPLLRFRDAYYLNGQFRISHPEHGAMMINLRRKYVLAEFTEVGGGRFDTAVRAVILAKRLREQIPSEPL